MYRMCLRLNEHRPCVLILGFLLGEGNDEKPEKVKNYISQQALTSLVSSSLRVLGPLNGAAC